MAEHKPYWFLDKGAAEIRVTGDITGGGSDEYVIEFEEQAVWEESDGAVSPIRRADHGETAIDGILTGGSTVLRVTMTGCYLNTSPWTDITDQAIAAFTTGGEYSAASSEPRIFVGNSAGKSLSSKAYEVEVIPLEEGAPIADVTKHRIIPTGAITVENSSESFNQTDQRGLALVITALPTQETIGGTDYWIRWKTGDNT